MKRKFKTLACLSAVGLMFGGITTVKADTSGPTEYIKSTVEGKTITLKHKEKDILRNTQLGIQINTDINSEVSNEVSKMLSGGYDVACGLNVSSFEIDIHKYACSIKPDGEDGYTQVGINVLYQDTNLSLNDEIAAFKTKDLSVDLNIMKDLNSKVTFSESEQNYYKDVIKRILGDNSIEVIFADNHELESNLTEEHKQASVVGFGDTSVLIYKNNLFYTGKMMQLTLYNGYRTKSGNTISMKEIAKTDATYTEMTKEISKKDITDIIGTYELRFIGGSFVGKLKLDIPVDPKYNGKEVVILHKKHDGTYETFTTKVVDGFATIEVSELSPFMVALSKEKVSTNKAEVASGNDKTTNNPQTSSLDIALYYIFAVISATGIVYLVTNRKKKKAAL